VAGCGRRAAAAGTPAISRPLPQVAIRNPAIATTVPSMTDIDQLEQNFAVMAQPFTAADQKILTAVWRDHPYFCRMCGTCAGQCPRVCR